MPQNIETAVIRILDPDGAPVGTGFLAEQSHALTCAHVVASALRLRETPAGAPEGEIHLDFPLVVAGKNLRAHISVWEPDDDVAVLELKDSPPEGASPATLVQAEDVWGHEFRAFGFPAQLDSGVWASGRLLGGQAGKWVQVEDVKITGYAIEPGFSGGPVWDQELGGVAGMVVAADTRREIKTAFMIPMKVLITAWPALQERAIPPSPYRGLSAFREVDAPFFFGRETFVEQLMDAVQVKPFVAVIGSSGSGKSSITYAGLLPRLRARQPTGGGTWLIADFRPRDQPYDNLANTLLPLLEPQLSEVDQLAETRKLASRLESGEITLTGVVGRALQKMPGASRLLLLADQFEELYTLSSKDSQTRFQDMLLKVVQAQPPIPMTLILTLRADFMEHALSHRPFADALQDAARILGPMDRTELEQAIRKPAEKLGVRFQDGLVARILDDVGAKAGNLPLLEFALARLWDKQEHGQITHKAYDEIGGVQGALAQHATSVFTRLSESEQVQARRVFIQLVQPGEGTEDTRRLASREELSKSDWALADKLATDRLVVTGRNPATGQETVEVVHEALIHGWMQLREWMQADRAFRAWQERLRDALQDWETSQRNEGELLRGATLSEAEKWLLERQADLNQAECVFILLSLALREQDAHNLDEAHQYCLKALEVDATQAEIYYSLHLLLLEMEKPDEALEKYLQAIGKKPELAVVPQGSVVTKILSASGPFITYLATNDDQGAIVYKVLKRAYEKRDVIEVLRQAADRSQKIDHPNIVKIVDFGELRNRHYIAREYVAGRTMRELIDEEGPLSLKASADALVPLSYTLGAIHSKGTVFGNLKPTNIYWAEPDLKLTDLGLAAITATEDYLAPEQHEGRAVPQSDVFAAGTIFYEMLTRRKPSDGILRSGLDNALELAIEIARAPTLHERYPSVDAFLSELGQVIPKQVAARPARGPWRVFALIAQVIREMTKRSWPWFLIATAGLGLLAPLFSEAHVLRQAVRLASVLLTLMLVLGTLIGWLSGILARQVRSAPIAAYGGAMGVLLSLASGVLWLRSLEFQMPNSPTHCALSYPPSLGLGLVDNLGYIVEVLPVYLIGSLVTSLFIFAAISATGMLSRRLGRRFSTGFWTGLVFWLPVLIAFALSQKYGWFGCF